MFDILPFPNITGTTPQEQVSQLTNYLIQFKEELEFVLTNLSADNLSGDLRQQLEALGANVETYKEEQQDATEQIVQNGLTISDVLNSPAFKASMQGVNTNVSNVDKKVTELDKKIDNVDKKIPTVYLVSAEQRTSSDEPGGINLYAIKDSSGTIQVLQIKNGETPDVEFLINFETGNLEYEIL